MCATIKDSIFYMLGCMLCAVCVAQCEFEIFSSDLSVLAICVSIDW